MIAAQRLEWPLTERELLVAGRKPSNYTVRFAIAAALCIPSAFAWWIGESLGGGFDLHDAQNLSGFLQGIIAISQFLIVFGNCTRSASTAVIDERDEGTLELLALADPRGWDIALSKWTAIMVQCTQLMFSFVPAYAVLSFFGGVDVVLVALMTGLYLIIAANVTAIGLYASSQQRMVSSANSVATVIIVAHGFAAWILWYAVDFGFALITRAGMAFLVPTFTQFPIITLVLYVAGMLGSTAFFLYWATRNIRKSASGEPATPQDAPAKAYPGTQHVSYDLNHPIAEFVTRGYREKARTVTTVAIFLLYALAVFVPVVGALGFCAFMLRDTVRTLSVMRRDGLWEEILLTRDDDRVFIQDVYRGLRKRHTAHFIGITLNLFIAVLRFGVSDAEGLFLWGLALGYLAVIAISTTYWGTMGAASIGTIRAREARANSGWLLWPLLGLIGSFVFAVVIGASRFNYIFDLMGEFFWIALFTSANMLWLFIGILVARSSFARKFDRIPEVAEPRTGLRAFLFGR